MAQVNDVVAAKVTLNAAGAIKDLGTLSRKAKETDQAFNKVGRGGALGGISGEAAKAAKSVDGLDRNSKKASGTLAGLRGSTAGVRDLQGTMAGAAAAVGFLTVGLKGTLDAQTRLNTAAASAKTTFKDASGEVERFADNAYRIGLSKRGALEAATGFGTLFRGLNYSTKASADFSISLTKLSSDLASKVGGSAEDAALALRAMFRGEFDPIEKYGVKVGEVQVANRALQLGLAATKGELSQQDKAMASLTLAFQQTADAQGDFNRRQGETANQQRILSAQMENAKANAGGIITPSYTQMLKGFNAVLGTSATKTKSWSDVLGEASEKALSYTTVLGFIGSRVKDNAGNFKDTTAALETFNRELLAGRDGSDAFRAAAGYLRKENEQSEMVTRRLGEVVEKTTDRRAAERAEQEKSLGSIQSLIGAQRAEQDASIRVLDARTGLADAERSLSELRSKGKVDAEQVADAEQRLRDASQSTLDARLRFGDAEKRLSELRAKGAVDAKRVVDAERSVVDASRSVVAARRAVAEAEREVARLRAGPTADEATEAARAIIRAQLDLERAQQRQLESLKEVNESRGADTLNAALGVREAELSLAEATDNLRHAQEAQQALNERGLSGSAAMTEAEQRLADARQSETDAIHRQREAEQAVRDARAGDPEFADKIAAAEREVDAARRGVESATRAQDQAAADLRKARAGDPEFERNLARATDDVTRAERELERANRDLPLAQLGARLAQDEFNAAVSDGTAKADSLRGMADHLGVSYNATAAAADNAAAAVHRSADALERANRAAAKPVDTRSGTTGGLLNSLLGLAASGVPVIGAFGTLFGREHGGPVEAGQAYVVGEKRPELFVPSTSGTILPRVPAGGSGPGGDIVITVNSVLDGAIVARSVTRHQAGKFLRGGSRP